MACALAARLVDLVEVQGSLAAVGILKLQLLFQATAQSPVLVTRREILAGLDGAVDHPRIFEGRGETLR